MSKRPMCPGSTRPFIIENNPRDYPTRADAWYGDRGARPERIKRKRLKCPRCGRRVWSSISTCHDGCCVLHFLPPHKSKGWWKRRKKRKVVAEVVEVKPPSICPKCLKRHEPGTPCQWWLSPHA